MSLTAKYAFRDCLLEPAGPRTVVSGPCYSCKTPQTVRVNTKDLDSFRAGKFAQDCFSYLTPGQREFLISGICDECWDKMFPESEEDA